MFQTRKWSILAVLFLASLGTRSAVAQWQFDGEMPPIGYRELIAFGAYYDLWQEYRGSPGLGFYAVDIFARPHGPESPDRYVDRFQDLNVTGVHQVWEIVPPRNHVFPTPYAHYFDDWRTELGPFDSYVGWLEEDESSGTPPTEINDGSNPGGLDPTFTDPLTGETVTDLIIGVGEFGVTSRGSGQVALYLASRDFETHVAHVVYYVPCDERYGASGLPRLQGVFGGEGDGRADNGGEIDYFYDVRLGDFWHFNGPPMIWCPEPSTATLLIAFVPLVCQLRGNERVSCRR